MANSNFDWRIRMKRLLLAMTITLAAFAQQPRVGADRRASAAYSQAGSGAVEVNISARNILWDASQRRLLAIFTSGGSGGMPAMSYPDSSSAQFFIAIINPQTGTIEQTFPIGDAPSTMAISDDGAFLYVGSALRSAVRRYRMSDHSLNLEIGLDPGSKANALIVPSGRRESVIVSTANGVIVYDGAVPRRQPLQKTNITAFHLRPSDKQLFGYGDGEISWIEVTATGVRATQAAQAFHKGNGIASFGGPFVVNEWGDVFDLDHRSLVGKIAIPYISRPLPPQPITCLPIVDPSGAVFAITKSSSISKLGLTRYSTDRFIAEADSPIKVAMADSSAKVRVTDLMPMRKGLGTSAIAWDDGMAINTGNKLIITAQRLFVERAPAPLPAPIKDPDGVIRIPISTNDIVYSGAQGKLAASISCDVNTYGNSVVLIDPATGELGTPFFAGSEPGAMAFSADGNRIFVGAIGTMTVNELNIKTGKLESIVPPSKSSHYSLLNFHEIESGRSCANLKNADDLYQIALEQAGLTTRKIVGRSWAEFGISDIVKEVTDQGKVFSIDGRVWAAGTEVPIANVWGGVPLPDSANRRVFYVNSEVIIGLDTETFQPKSIGYAAYTPRKLPSPGDTEKAARYRDRLDTRVLMVDGKTIVIRTDDEVILFPISAMKPWPAPTAPTDEPMPGVRRINLVTNDLAADGDGKLVASMPGWMGAWGNSIIRIDPRTGSVENATFVGNEPGRMALSPDGSSVFVWLTGEGRIGRVNLRQGKRDLVFAPDLSAGSSGSSGLTKAKTYRCPGSVGWDAGIAVNPVSGQLAVALDTADGGISMYDNAGKRLPASIRFTASDWGGLLPAASSSLPRVMPPARDSNEKSTRLFFDKSGQILYGCQLTIKRAQVTKNGLSLLSSSGQRIPSGAQYDDGLIYTIDAQGIEAIDPETFRMAGLFVPPREKPQTPARVGGIADFLKDPRILEPKDERQFNENAILPDSKSQRLYALIGRRLLVFAMSSRAAIGELQLPPQPKSTALASKETIPIKIVKLGTDNLAIRTNQEIFIVSISAIPKLSQSAPSAPPGLPKRAEMTAGMSAATRVIQVQASDLAFDPTRNLLYASLSRQNETPDAGIIKIDPAKGEQAGTVFAGTAPNRLLLSQDSRYLYMLAADGLKRLDLSSGTILRIADAGAKDFAAIPGAPGSIAVAGINSIQQNGIVIPTGYGVRIYDDDKQRRQFADLKFECDRLGFGTPNLLYCYTNQRSVTRLSVTAGGVSVLSSVNQQLAGKIGNLIFDGGLLYTSNGLVIDLESMTEKARLRTETAVSSSSPLPGLSASLKISLGGGGPIALGGERIYWLLKDLPGNAATLRAYDRQSLALLMSNEIKLTAGEQPDKLTPCGDNRLAFRAGGDIYIITLQSNENSGEGKNSVQGRQ
jgi:DNA-binding beta-propeller fold protein YncE